MAFPISPTNNQLHPPSPDPPRWIYDAAVGAWLTYIEVGGGGGGGGSFDPTAMTDPQLDGLVADIVARAPALDALRDGILDAGLSVINVRAIVGAALADAAVGGAAANLRALSGATTLRPTEASGAGNVLNITTAVDSGEAAVLTAVCSITGGTPSLQISADNGTTWTTLNTLALASTIIHWAPKNSTQGVLQHGLAKTLDNAGNSYSTFSKTIARTAGQPLRLRWSSPTTITYLAAKVMVQA